MSNVFTKMIQNLRQSEELVLYGHLPAIKQADEATATTFLEAEYKVEVLEYPFNAPEFDGAAAIWAAKIVFNAAQLLLYREQKVPDIAPLFAIYAGPINAGAILSADITLRFLPDIVLKIKQIDEDDAVWVWLDAILRQWHYSGVRYLQDPEGLDFSWIKNDPCLYQMYINRVIAWQNLSLAKTPEIRNGVLAALGAHGAAFWKLFYNEIQISHESNG